MSLLLTLFAVNGGAAANTPPPTTPPGAQPQIVITGSRVATAPDELGANVTVLSREDFAVEKPVKLADVLRRVAGVHVDQVGGRGGTGSLYLRGADPNYTLVLVDGVRVNDPTNARGGSFDFSTFDVADIERVEVARGPYSAVYGGDALAGVINIVTRHAPRGRTQASVEAMGGAYDTREFAVDAGGPLSAAGARGNWNLAAGDSHEGQVVRGNRFESRRVSGSLDGTIGESTTLYLSGRHTDSQRAGFPDDSGGWEFATLRDTETRDADETVLGAGVSTRVGAATFSLTTGYFDRDDHIDSPGVAPGIRDPFGLPPNVVDTRLRRYSATLSGTQKISDLLSVAYGVDWLREEGRSDGALDFGGGFMVPTTFELTRTSWAPFTEVRLDSGLGLSAQAGVRFDKPDGMDSVTSPRVRVAYEFAGSGVTLAGAWGKAFKLPSLYALGHPLVGNPELAPERGQSHEIELSQSLLDGRARWSATWFDGEFRNAIDFDPGPPPRLVNRNLVDTDGFELAANLALGEHWRFDGSVTHARSRIGSSGEQLRNRPEWRGGLAAHWSPLSALDFSLSATHVGSSRDSSIATGDVRLEDYTRFDVSASWQVSTRLEAWVAVDNLTDQQYQEFIGFETRGIAPRAGVRFSF
ncbi:MAG TPA: TonB-dependent receptor [Steroidobacteraceae bacterium]|nr:TonB-dependent receptor [Steroidobacteraceae bacterium]